MAFDFVCISCKWAGTDPVLDAHSNPFCPRCGRPAEFGDIIRMREPRKSGSDQPEDRV